MKPISIIVAIAENNAIGKNNQLLCHIPGDLKRLRKITTGHTVVMGKRTYFSLPKRPLPDRTNIVVSDDRNDHFEGCVMAYSIEEALDKCNEKDENFILGGGIIYREFFPFANKLYLTRIFKTFEADTFFPEIDPMQWIVREQTDVTEETQGIVKCLFVIMEKNRQ
jgi:dihydrofolate reductase